MASHIDALRALAATSFGNDALPRSTTGYTPSPAVQQIVQAAPPPPRANVSINRAQAQARNVAPPSALRSNPVVQELLSRAIQYYTPPVMPRTVPVAPQPNFRVAQANTMRPRLQPGGYDVGAQNALADMDQVQFEIARAQEANRGQQTSMGFQNDPAAAGRLLQLRDMQAGIVSHEQQRLQQQRASQEFRAIAAFPQMTRDEIGNLTDQQLDSLVALAPTQTHYDPLSGPKAGTPARTTRTSQELQAGDLATELAQLQVQQQNSGPYPNPGLQARIGQTEQEIERLTGQPAIQADNTGMGHQLVDAGQYAWNALPDAMTGTGPISTAAGAVVDAGQYAWDQVPDPVKDTLTSTAKGTYETFKSIAVPVTDRVKWSLVFGTGMVADNLGKISYLEEHAPEVRQAFEAISKETGKPWREQFMDAMNLMDEPRQYNVDQMGDLWYQNATGTRTYDGRVSGKIEIGGYHPLGMTPFDVAYEVTAQFIGKDELDTRIVDAYTNGYSSPSYLEQQANVPPDQQKPEFTGGRAVWEMLVSTFDDLTPAQRLVVLGLLDTVMDPLTYVGVVAGAGEGVKVAGAALREGTDNVIVKGVGLAVEGAGVSIKTAAELPDAPFIVGGHLAGQALRATGNLGGALSESVRSMGSKAESDLDTYIRTIKDAPPAPAGTGAAPVPAAAPASASTAAPTGAGARTRSPRRPVGPVYGPSVPTSSPASAGPVPRRPRGGTTAAGSTVPPSSTVPASPVEEAAAGHGVTLTTGAPPPPSSTVEAEPHVSNPTERTPSSTEAEAATPTTAKPKQPQTAASDPYPTLTKAEGRSNVASERHTNWRGTGESAVSPADRETPLSASTEGDQGFLDDLATDASRLPDTPENAPIKQQANDFLEAVETRIGAGLRDDPLWRNWSEGGVRFDVPSSALTDDVVAAINASSPNTYIGSSNLDAGALDTARAAGLTVYDLANRGDALKARNLLNSISKDNLERLAEYGARVDAAALYTATYGEIPRGAIIPEPVRLMSPAGTPASHTQQSADWLAWRYITGSEDDATRIGQILGGNQKLFDTSTGRPVATRYATPALTDEALIRLREARDKYQFIVNPTPTQAAAWSDPGILKRIVDSVLSPQVHFAHPAVMMMPGSGLRAKSKQFADWFRRLDELNRRVADGTEMAVGDDYLRILYTDHRIDYETAEFGSRVIPYSPDVPYSGLAAGMPGTMTVQEALEFVSWREGADKARLAAMTPSARARAIPYNAAAERRNIAHLAAGLAPTTRPTSAAGRGAWKALRAYDKGMSFFRNAKLAGPVTGFGGMMNDIIGNSFAKMISGNASWRDISNLMPWRIGRWIDDFRALGRDEIAFSATRSSQYLKDTGAVLPTDLMPGFRGMEDIHGGLPPINAAVANKPWLVRALANLGSVPAFMDARRVHEVIDRLSIFEGKFRAELDASLSHGIRGADTAHGGAFFEAIERAHPGDGAKIIEDIRAEARTRAGKQWSGGISPEDVLKATGDHDLTRAWQGEINRAVERGKAESHRVFFSGASTKADEVARRAFTFHYWQTRASIFHLRTATRNPILLNTYWKLWQDINDRSAGLPRGLQSMVKVFTSGQGISAAINGFGYLLPMTALDMTDQDGNQFAQLFHLVAPMIQGILAAGGADYSPNVDPFRGTEKLIVALINQAKVDGVPLDEIPIIGSHIDTDTLTNNHITEDIINAITSEVNDRARGLLDKLGIPIGEFKPFDRDAYDYDLQVSAVQQVMEGMYGPRETWAQQPNGEQILSDYNTAVVAVANGSDGNPIAQQAQAIVAEQQLISAGGNALLPGTAAWSDFRFGVQTDQAAAIASLENGTPLTPAQQGALDNRQDATGADTLWNTVSDAYHRLGTPEQQDLYYTAQTILANDSDLSLQWIPAYTPDGQKVWVAGYELARMTDAERVAWVEQWLTTWPNGIQQYQSYDQSRQQFLADHPEYQDFKTYQGAVYDDPRGFRTQLAKTDPNFQRAMEAEQDRLEGQGYKGEKLQQQLDDWAKGESAYRAAIGQKVHQKDPDPLAVYDPTADVTQNPGWPQPKESKPPKSTTSFGDSGLFRKDFAEEPADDPSQREAQLYKLLEQYPQNKDVIAQITAIEKPADLSDFNQAVSEWQQVNQSNEQLYGDAWNSDTGEWESWAGTEKKRANAGLPSWVPYPPKPEILQTYWWWVQQYGNSDIQDYIDWWYENRDRPEFFQATPEQGAHWTGDGRPNTPPGYAR